MSKIINFIRTYLFILIIGIIIGVLASVIYMQCLYTPPKCEADTYILLSFYYFSSSIGAIATAFAIATALFNKEIREWFFSPSCNVSLVDDGFHEMQSTTDDGEINVDAYSCDLKVKNSGNVEMEDCELYIDEVKYRTTGKTPKWKNLSNVKCRKLYWEVPNNYKATFPPKDSRTVPIARIYPKSSDSTPDNKLTSDLRLQIMGYNIEKCQNNQARVWLIKYHIKSSTKILSSFEIEIEWDGKWFKRLESMNVSATLKS